MKRQIRNEGIPDNRSADKRSLSDLPPRTFAPLFIYFIFDYYITQTVCSMVSIDTDTNNSTLRKSRTITNFYNTIQPESKLHTKINNNTVSDNYKENMFTHGLECSVLASLRIYLNDLHSYFENSDFKVNLENAELNLYLKCLYYFTLVLFSHLEEHFRILFDIMIQI